MHPQKFKNSLRTLAAIFASLMTTASVYAADITVSGIVTDVTGEPLIGASVVVVGQTTGVATDFDGNYSITVADNGKLQFSYIGFENKTIAVEGRSHIDVVMAENTATLNELVVVGYGQMKKSDLTGAVGSMGARDIKDVPVASVGQALQGRISGVQVIDAAKPGDNVTIKIRGIGSTRNSDPLVVIDGVPTELGINSLNPQDIERLDVLKDASATAIYGSRGANGVVMITTRRGAEGTPRLNFSANVAVQTAARTMDLLDAAGYASLNNDMMLNSGRNVNPEWVDPSALGKGTDWMDALLTTGVMQNYNISYSGGNDKAHYYFSAGFLDQTGIVENVDYRRFTFQSNNDARLTSWLKVSNNLLFSTDRKRSGRYNMTSTMRALPTFSIKDEDGNWTGPEGNAEWYGSTRNPIGENEVYRSTTNGYNLLANISADIYFTNWLQFRSTFGYDAHFWYNEAFSPAYDWKPIPEEESSNYEGDYRSFTYLWDNYFTFDKTFGKHALNVMAGTSAQWNDYRYLTGQMNGFLFDNVHQMNNGMEMYAIYGSRSEWSLLSYMARANYSFDNRYMLTATVRRDGSSRFGPKQRWGTFPSVSAAWRISNESFYNRESVVNDLKLRLGYGRTGSQASVSDLSYLPTLNTLTYPFGSTNTNQYALVAQTLANPYIHWETIEQFNAGVDLSLFNSRLNVTLDGYIKNTHDMLVKSSVPITSGFEDTMTTYSNAGKMRNMGWELSANSLNINNELTWETSLVVTYNHNRIKDLNSDTPEYLNQVNNSFVTMLDRDYPVNVFYGYVTDGIFQSTEEVRAHAIQPGAEPGDIRFKDLNNDGVINDEDRTVIGNPNPTWLFSLGNRLTYKGFELSIYFQGVAGNKIYNATRIDMEGMAAAYNQYATVADRWTTPGQVTDMPRAVWADPNQNCRVSDRFVEDGSYIRLKNITLSYNLPSKLLRRFALEQARVTFSCENVATITGYSGLDPEVGVSGIDYSTFPSSRTFNFGLSFNF